MGYFIDEISKQPDETTAKVSLSKNPNFVIFENNSDKENKPVDISIDITGKGVVFEIEQGTMVPVDVTKFTIAEAKTSKSYELQGTSNRDLVKDYTYYIGPSNEFGVSTWELWQIADSLYQTLLKIDFIANNFDVTLPPAVNESGNLVRGTKINIKSKGYGKDFAFSISADDNRLYTKYIKLTGNPLDTEWNDSINEGYTPVEIQLDLYKDTGVFLGQDDTPNASNMGTYVTTLSKSYHGEPLWFNINALDAGIHTTDILDPAKEYRWLNTRTMRSFRYAAKRFINDTKKTEKNIFYYSGVFYIVDGYHRTLEKNDLAPYIYNTAEDNVVQPLTSQPELTHIKGQTQYFNFILSDPEHTAGNSTQIGLRYKTFSSSGRQTGEFTTQVTDIKELHMVNTIKLDIDSLIEQHKDTAFVEVYLFRPDKDQPVSHSLRFRILPKCLYKVNDFAFLNRLGGWSSFNFPGTEKTDFKTKATTIYQTHTPGKTINSQIESVYNKTVSESFSVETMPATREVCDWLKELSTSRAVYELSTGRYVIVDELNIKHDTKDELFRMEMKYHYSDSFNAVIE